MAGRGGGLRTLGALLVADFFHAGAFAADVAAWFAAAALATFVVRARRRRDP